MECLAIPNDATIWLSFLLSCLVRQICQKHNISSKLNSNENIYICDSLSPCWSSSQTLHNLQMTSGRACSSSFCVRALLLKISIDGLLSQMCSCFGFCMRARYAEGTTCGIFNHSHPSLSFVKSSP